MHCNSIQIYECCLFCVRRTSPRSTAPPAVDSESNMASTMVPKLPVAVESSVDDGPGELVSDGIVTWRRKLPDIGLVARVSANKQHQYYYHQVRSEMNVITLKKRRRQL